MRRFATGCTAVVIVLIAFAKPAQADSIAITNGFVGEFNGIDLPGFTLTGTGSSFSGILPIGGPSVCCVFNPGDVVQLDSFFPGVSLSSLAGQPSLQVVSGTSYQAYVSGSLAFTTVPFTAPSPSGLGFSFSSPFTATGHISGFEDFARTIPLFSVDLTGSGTATVSGRVISGPTFLGQGLGFQFGPAAPAPTPEPVSALLLGTGVAGLMLWRRIMI
jgi:hypothetical protein